MRPQNVVSEELPGPYAFSHVIGRAAATGAGLLYPLDLAVDQKLQVHEALLVLVRVGVSAHGNAVSSCRHVSQLRDSFLKAVNIRSGRVPAPAFARREFLPCYGAGSPKLVAKHATSVGGMSTGDSICRGRCGASTVTHG